MSTARCARPLFVALAVGLCVSCTSGTQTSPSGVGSGASTVDLSPHVLAITRVVIREGPTLSGPVVSPRPDGSYELKVASVPPAPAYLMEVWANYAPVSDPQRRTEGTVVASYPIGSVFRGIGIGAGGPAGERTQWAFSFQPPPAAGPGYTITVGYVETSPGTSLRHDVSKVVAITAVP